MSTVPPSPAWATTRTSRLALHLQRRRDAGRDRGRVAEQRVEPRDPPRGLGVGRREHLEAAGRVHRDELAVRRAHRRVERVASAERLAASLAGAVARVERVRAVRVGLDRPIFVVEEAVADREAADLVEAHGLWCVIDPPQPIRDATVPRSRRMFSAEGPERRVAPIRARSRSTMLVVEVEEGERLEPIVCRVGEHRLERALGDRPPAEAGDDGAQRERRRHGSPSRRRSRARRRSRC